MTISLPPKFNDSLPDFLLRADVNLLFAHWNLGGRSYVNRLVDAGQLKFNPRPCARGGVISTEIIIDFYQKLCPS